VKIILAWFLSCRNFSFLKVAVQRKNNLQKNSTIKFIRS
jgi:hypothetical protein